MQQHGLGQLRRGWEQSSVPRLKPEHVEGRGWVVQHASPQGNNKAWQSCAAYEPALNREVWLDRAACELALKEEVCLGQAACKHASPCKN